MRRVLIANDEMGAMVWRGTLAKLGVEVVAAVQSGPALMAALDEDSDVDIVLVSGMGLGMPIAGLVDGIRKFSDQVAILAVPARGESAAELAREGADVVLAGPADLAARELAVGQTIQAQVRRQELPRTNRWPGRAPRPSARAGTVTPELAEFMLDNVPDRPLARVTP